MLRCSVAVGCCTVRLISAQLPRGYRRIRKSGRAGLLVWYLRYLWEVDRKGAVGERDIGSPGILGGNLGTGRRMPSGQAGSNECLPGCWRGYGEITDYCISIAIVRHDELIEGFHDSIAQDVVL